MWWDNDEDRGDDDDKDHEEGDDDEDGDNGQYYDAWDMGIRVFLKTTFLDYNHNLQSTT